MHVQCEVNAYTVYCLQLFRYMTWLVSLMPSVLETQVQRYISSFEISDPR